jgi:hypothetical protein
VTPSMRAVSSMVMTGASVGRSGVCVCRMTPT